MLHPCPPAERCSLNGFLMRMFLLSIPRPCALAGNSSLYAQFKGNVHHRPTWLRCHFCAGFALRRVARWITTRKGKWSGLSASIEMTSRSNTLPHSIDKLLWKNSRSCQRVWHCVHVRGRRRVEGLQCDSEQESLTCGSERKIFLYIVTWIDSSTFVSQA